MRQLTRLLRYVFPYWWQLLSSILLMAAVGLLDAFRVLLIGPIFDRVLNPGSPEREMQLFKVPFTGNAVYLQQFVPSHFRNPWTVVAFALVAATVLKGIFDYAGTYLVNYAGFGMITDLRNELYNSILKRSSAFYQKHTTGTLLSTIVNDIERVQFAMSSVLAEFLQQFFTLVFTAFVVVLLGGKLAWVLLLFVPFIIFSAGRIGQRVRQTTRKGQDKLADIQNILHETISGNRIVKAFSMESWEIARFAKAAQRLFRANLRSVAAAAISSPLMDIFGAIAIALLLLLGREQINRHVFTAGTFLAFIIAVFKLYDPVRKFALFNNNFQQAIGASSEIFKFMDTEDDVREKPGAQALPGNSARHQSESTGGRSGGRGGIERRRQEHHGPSDSKIFRRNRRAPAHRRPRRARYDALLAAFSDRCRHPGDGAFQRHPAQQHRLRAALHLSKAG
jgi:subfamily B ATP-binding cassette protein MsbA